MVSIICSECIEMCLLQISALEVETVIMIVYAYVIYLHVQIYFQFELIPQAADGTTIFYTQCVSTFLIFLVVLCLYL